MAGPDDDGSRPWNQGLLGDSGLSRVKLEPLLQELVGRVDEIMDTQERLRALLDAIVGIGADLDLSSTLDRIVNAACELVGARYGALGVMRPDGKRLSRFITRGITDEEIGRIGNYPEGLGLLGLLIDHPEPLRLAALSEHPRSYGFPPNHPPMKSFLGVPIRTGARVYGNLYLTEKADGADFTEDDERTVLALAAAAGVVIDNARLYVDAERRRRWHEATAEITQFMLGEFDPQEGLDLVASKARDVSRSTVGAILLRLGDEFVVQALDAPPALRHYLGRRVSANLPILADLLGAGQRVVIENLAQFAKENGLPAELEDLGRTIVVPLPPGTDHSGGALVVAADQGAVLSITPGTDLLEMFANQTTLALDRVQGRRNQAVLAVLEDRDRIARDLHDLVIQRLFATGLQLQSMQRTLEPRSQDRIARAVDELDTTIRDLRAAIFELHRRPGDNSLRAGVSALVSEYADALGFRPRLTVSGPVDTAVPLEVRPHLLAALREALSNVVRHAGADQVDVDLEVIGYQVVLRVADNGVGITDPDRHSGLRNLRERAAAVEGSMHLAPNQPHGTILELRAPL